MSGDQMVVQSRSGKHEVEQRVDDRAPSDSNLETEETSCVGYKHSDLMRALHPPQTMQNRPLSGTRKDSFQRRHKTLRRKAHELAALSGARVYVAVLFHRRYYTYTSHEGRGWPPLSDEIV